MKTLKLNSHAPEQTHFLGKQMGKLAQSGDLFLLTGALGAGKTYLAQGIARGLGIEECVLSPSFVLIREYHGRLPLYHMDFYRLDCRGEIASLGLEEYFHRAGVCVIEWAEKGLSILPRDNLLIALNYIPASETERTICLTPKGQRYLDIISQLQLILNQEGICTWP